METELSLLITGGSGPERLLVARQHAEQVSSKVDTLEFDATTSGGISTVREIIHAVSRRPFQSSLTSVIITEADKLTPESQNALLKLLEEPPEHSQLILCTANKNSLLATVVSRCLEITLENFEANQDSSIDQLLAMSFSERLEFIEKTSLEDYLTLWHGEISKSLLNQGISGISLKWLWQYSKLLLKLKKASRIPVNKKLVALILALELPSRG